MQSIPADPAVGSNRTYPVLRPEPIDHRSSGGPGQSHIHSPEARINRPVKTAKVKTIAPHLRLEPRQSTSSPRVSKINYTHMTSLAFSIAPDPRARGVSADMIHWDFLPDFSITVGRIHPLPRGAKGQGIRKDSPNTGKRTGNGRNGPHGPCRLLPDRPGRFPSQAPHRSGRAGLPHPARQSHGFATLRMALCTTRGAGNGKRRRNRLNHSQFSQAR